MGPGREFDIIRAMRDQWGSLARGLGDDAAVLVLPVGEQLVVSTDTSVEGIHFRREWLSASEIGYRAAAAALSDLAAMAAHPVGMLIALTLPEQWRAAVDGLAAGLGEVAQGTGVPIVGGNISAGGELSITTTVLGHAEHPVSRRGACRGDAIFVTGRFGGPATALRDLAGTRTPAAAHMTRLARPAPRIVESHWLAAQGTSAMIDVSDGLAADLGHLAAASGVRIVFDVDSVPRLADVDPIVAATGGDEYELALTAPRTLDGAEFEREFLIPLTRIGRVVDGLPGVEARRGMRIGGDGSDDGDGERVDLPAGHDHLSR